MDGDGKLLGINTNRLGSGFYQAIAADAALKDRVAALGRGGHRPADGSASDWRRHTWRGSCAGGGVGGARWLLVREVEDDSPAAKAGVAEGDLIVAAAGKPVTSADDLFDAIGWSAPRRRWS